MFSKTLWQMMVWGVVCSIVLTVIGLAMSYSLGLPPGATIALAAGAFYLVTAAAARLASRGR